MALSLTESIITAVLCISWISLIVILLPSLSEPDLSKPGVQPQTSEDRRCPLRGVFTAAQKLGAHIMSVVDEALARLTSFVNGVLGQVKAAKDTNDAQTAKLAELQAKLDTATSDDEADKAAIATLKAEIDTLQASVAAQINAAVDALENPPVVDAPVAVDVAAPVEAPVEAPVDETPAAPVE